jgi:hypothetical protein
MEMNMTKQFAVRKLDSVLAPSFCSGAYEIASQGWEISGFIAIYTCGVTGYYMLGCYFA